MNSYDTVTYYIKKSENKITSPQQVSKSHSEIIYEQAKNNLKLAEEAYNVIIAKPQYYIGDKLGARDNIDKAKKELTKAEKEYNVYKKNMQERSSYSIYMG
jgi:hypothetical protein